eukprot:TRINITY_DN616_c0_g1_i1.p1 TRINITY_DN616_c0_g1~~TRINITY_DN616_c0_g1_i1.p1  ORF type:complete len:131 (-),score=46.26 TRINITY_DN616_c0_g1_i1:84-476(-)
MDDLLSSVFPFAPAQEDLVLRFAHMCLEVEVVLAEELAMLKNKYDGIVASASPKSAVQGVGSCAQSATMSNSGATATTTNVVVAGVGSGSVGDSLKDYDEDTSSSDDDGCLLYTSPSPRDRTRSRMPSSA